MKFLTSLLFFFSIFTINAQTIINVKDFGAKGNNITDDTKSIQDAIDKAATLINSTVFFPSGTYLVSRKSKSIAGCLYFKSNVNYIGDSIGNSTIQLANAQLNYTRIVYIEKVHNIIIKNLVMDGNAQGQTKTNGKYNEHLHSYYLNEAVNIQISHCVFKNSGGDGIGIRGVGNNPSTNINIKYCKFTNSNRDAITLGSGFNKVEISYCQFDSTVKSSIHAEPESGITQNVWIHHNQFNKCYNLSIAGAAKTKTLTSNVIIEYNLFENCNIWLCRATNIKIRNNEFVLSHKLNALAAIACVQINDSIYIESNQFNLINNYALKVTSTTTQAKMVRFEKNKVESNFNLVDNFGCLNLIVNNNNLFLVNNAQIMNVSINYPIDNIEFSNNKLNRDIEFGLLRASRGKVKKLIISNNSRKVNLDTSQQKSVDLFTTDNK
jgi:hypothetical protein